MIQLRLKNESPDVVLATAKHAKEICHRYDALFLINDFWKVAQAVGADGVHLGQGDDDISEVRKVLGDDFIIGGTANTFDQVQELVAQKVSYIGLGSYRFTTTKRKLSPLLGLRGYQEILAKMKKNQLFIPVFAVGGIRLQDIVPLRNTGVFGVAVSGLLAESIGDVVDEIRGRFNTQF